MKSPLRYICCDCGQDLIRCLRCESLIHSCLDVHATGTMHTHPRCPALDGQICAVIREVAVA